MDNPPRYPLFWEKYKRHKRYAKCSKSKKEKSLKDFAPNILCTSARETQKRRYSSNDDKESGDRFSEKKPEESRKVEGIDSENMDEHIICMKRYHTDDSNAPQNVDFSESLIHESEYSKF